MEQLITLKTAKQLKEIDFDESTQAVYWKDGVCDREEDYLFYRKYKDVYPAVSQSNLQKWLREKHNIDIVINPMNLLVNKVKVYFIALHGEDSEELTDWQLAHEKILNKAHQDVPGNFVNDELFDKYAIEDRFSFRTYEEALEEGLIKGLKLISDVE